MNKLLPLPFARSLSTRQGAVDVAHLAETQ
jgi:hypothetical protein